MADEFNKILENLGDIVSIQSRNIDRLGDKLERSNAQLTSQIGDLAIQIGEQAQSIDRLERSIDRLTENIDRMTTTIERKFDQIQSSIDAHLRVAEAQTANIAELTKLVATQAATVNKLLDRAVA